MIMSSKSPSRQVGRRSEIAHPRRGYLYVGVMMTALLVSAIGVSALTVARLQLDVTQRQNDWASAQALARTAIEDALRKIDNDLNWRTSLTQNTEYPDPPHDLAPGSFTWSLADPDGDLADSNADGVWLTGIGRVGDATFAETVLVQPTGQPLTCLEAAFHCASTIRLGTGADLTTNQLASSNSSIDASTLLAKIDGNTEAVGTISGSITGTKVQGITPRSMPGDTAFEYYLRNGTWIDRDSLPVSGGFPLINKAVLSPSLNPYGSTTNPEGIYVIDCRHEQLTIMNTRILGTLVLVNSSASTYVDFSHSWSPAVLNYPTLLVEGDISFRFTRSNLDESVQGTNFNPTGAPYEESEDADKSDVYPSQIKGLVYISGQLKLPLLTPDKLVDGCVVCGSVDFKADSTFDYRATFLNYPPPGFASGNPMRIAPGTWHRTAVP